MKTLLSVLIFALSLSATAQTSVISVKSHQGKINSVVDASDHFGYFEPPKVFDTIIKIDAHCVVQLGWQDSEDYRFRDTICAHWYYEEHNYSEQKIQEFHGDHTVLIGFTKETNSINQQDRPFGNRTQRQSIPFIFIFLVLAGLGAYIARSLRTTKNTL